MPKTDTTVKVKRDHFRIFWEWLHRVNSSSLPLSNNFTVYSACTRISIVMLRPDWIGKHPDLYHLSLTLFFPCMLPVLQRRMLPRWPCVNLSSVCLTGSHRERRHGSRGSNSRKSEVMCAFLISWVVFSLLVSSAVCIFYSRWLAHVSICALAFLFAHQGQMFLPSLLSCCLN